MSRRWNPSEHLYMAKYAGAWLVLGSSVAMVIGVAVSLFVKSLDLATQYRWDHERIFYLLPVGGLLVVAMYHYLGKKGSESGNNLILDEIHEPGGGVPLRMAPLVWVGTVLSHLFGASVGREGTAVQMGGSIAGAISRIAQRHPRWNQRHTRTLLMVGIAAGFGAVFGTPLSATIFALEVLAIGQMSYQALFPCLIAGVVGDQTCRFALHHLHYTHANYNLSLYRDLNLSQWNPLNAMNVIKVFFAGICFGIAGVIFSELAHLFSDGFKRLIGNPFVRVVVGALIFMALTYWIGFDFLGLGTSAPPSHPGLVNIKSCFLVGGAQPLSWFWKLLFTTIALGCGFKGGEVTPLFFIGAALGNVLGQWLGFPVELLAALGFVSVFAAGTNTPLAGIIMGIEIFASATPDLLSSPFVVYLAISCFVAYLFSGTAGIYRSQKSGRKY